MEKTITKAVPVVGGVVSGGLTYLAFRPMGRRLADTLVMHVNGEFAEELELSPQFVEAPADAVVEADIVSDPTEEPPAASR